MCPRTRASIDANCTGVRCDSLLLSPRYNVTYASPNDTSGFARYPDVATYRCEGGFYASPAIHMRTCFTDGTWDRAPMHCEVQCAHPDPVGPEEVALRRSVDVSDCVGKLLGQTCYVPCAMGYRGRPKVLTCQDTHRFSGEMPSCADACAEKDLSDEAALSGVAGYVSGANYSTCALSSDNTSCAVSSCRKGFAKAAADGTTVARCDPVAAAAAADSPAVGLQFGADLAGAGALECVVSDACMTATLFDLERVGGLPAHLGVTHCTQVLSDKSSVCAATVCVPGYTARDEQGSQVTCTPSGESFSLSYSGQLRCEPKRCAALQVRGGLVDVSNDGLYPSEATTRCYAGHTLTSDAARTCGTDGNWSGVAAACPAKRCDALSLPRGANLSYVGTLAPGGDAENHTAVLSALTYPSTAHLQCGWGYISLGPTVRTCDADGVWSGAARARREAP